MTISSTTNRVSFAGNGSTTAFATGFKFFTNTDLTVILVVDSTGVETTQTITTNYTVAGAGEDAGGTVTMLVAPATGETLIIIRAQPYTQGLDLVENDEFPSDSVEQTLDKNVIMAQQNLDSIGRSVKLSEGDTSGFSLTLPSSHTAGALLAVNSGATAYEYKAVADITAATFPGAATDNAFVRFDGTTGTSVQNGQTTEDDSGNVVVAGTATASNGALIANVVEDTTPQLGGDLDANGNDINMGDNTISRPKLIDYGETVNIIGSIGGGTQDIDLTLGNVVSGTVDTSTTTFTFSNPPATGTEGGFKLYLTNGGSQTVNWPASVDWVGGTAPTLTSSGVDVIVFSTIDGGTTWYGFAAGLAMA